MKKINLTGKEKNLVVRTDRIGDVILSTPVLEAIKSSYPKSHVTMMISPYTKDIVKNNPHLDDVIIDDYKDVHRGTGGFFRLVKKIRGEKFDVCVLLHPTFRLALLLFLSGIRYRIGTGYRWYQIFFNRKIYQHRKKNLKHESDYNMDMLKPLGIKSQRILPKVYLSKSEENLADRIFENFEIKKQEILLAIHPGSGDSSLNLPIKRFAQAADRLVEDMNAKVIITGTKREKELAHLMENYMQNKPVNLVGKTGLRELASLLKKVDILISNSTGPMHLSAALGTPTVAVFCPIFAAGPIRWAPLGDGHEVILPPVPICFKCKPKSCPYYDCMEKIKAEQIVSSVKSILKEKIMESQSQKARSSFDGVETGIDA
jgi:lipopolysaccharide heptosyltransferase II